MKRFAARALIIGLVFLMMFFIFGMSCQAPSPTPSPAPKPAPSLPTIDVEISGFAFVPATVNISVGTTVTWTNKDSATHTVSSRNALFDSGNLSRGATFSYTFNKSGTFEYYCKIHPRMTAKVIVE